MLDKVLNDNFYMYAGHTFGFLSFNSLIRLFIKMMSLLHINISSSLFELANSYIGRFEYTKKVAINTNYNAFVTCFANFYIDFGLIGVIIMSVLFGIVTSHLYKKFEKDSNIVNRCRYCIVIYFIIFSVVRFQMSNTTLGLSIIYSLIILPYLLKDKKNGNYYD